MSFENDYYLILKKMCHYIDDTKIELRPTKGLDGNVLKQFSTVISQELISRQKVREAIEAASHGNAKLNKYELLERLGFKDEKQL